MSYRNTFIQIAPDSQATTGIIPESTRQTTPIHMLQHQLLTEKPYYYTHEDLVFEVHLIRQGLSEEERRARGEEIHHQLFRKEHPCLRASALTKQYGWGAHYDEEGKIALYAVDSDEYTQLSDTCPHQLMAMRTKRVEAK